MEQANLDWQAKEKRWVAATSVVAAIFLTALKLIVGYSTGSLGILAEAAHSSLDLAAAVITWVAVRMSDRPADESHPYGHGKVESLSALFETGLLLLTCLWIFYEAIRRLFFVEIEVNPSLWAFLTMGISIIVDFSRSRALARVARKYHSQALEADALHFSTDIWSSTVVLVGLGLVRYGEVRGTKSIFVRADAIAALIVACIVVYVSVRLGRRTVDALLDRAPKGLAESYVAALSGVEGVLRTSHVRVRNVGSQVFVDLTVSVPRHLSFEESHEITRTAKEKLLSLSPNADVVVDAAPAAENEGILERIQGIAVRSHAAVHNITTHMTERGGGSTWTWKSIPASVSSAPIIRPPNWKTCCATNSAGTSGPAGLPMCMSISSRGRRCLPRGAISPTVKRPGSGTASRRYAGPSNIHAAARTLCCTQWAEECTCPRTCWWTGMVRSPRFTKSPKNSKCGCVPSSHSWPRGDPRRTQSMQGLGDPKAWRPRQYPIVSALD